MAYTYKMCIKNNVFCYDYTEQTVMACIVYPWLWLMEVIRGHERAVQAEFEPMHRQERTDISRPFVKFEV
jgi:hypothetical protein